MIRFMNFKLSVQTPMSFYYYSIIIHYVPEQYLQQVVMITNLTLVLNRHMECWVLKSTMLYLGFTTSWVVTKQANSISQKHLVGRHSYLLQNKFYQRLQTSGKVKAFQMMFKWIDVFCSQSLSKNTVLPTLAKLRCYMFS